MVAVYNAIWNAASAEEAETAPIYVVGWGSRRRHVTQSLLPVCQLWRRKILLHLP